MGLVGTISSGQANVSSVQPLDGDLTAIAALTTTAYGRDLLTLANQAALRTAVGAASETATGVIELATEAEVVAGVDTTRAVTPAALSAAIDAALGGDSGRRDLDDLLGTTGKFFARVKNGLVTISFDPNRTGYAFWSSAGTIELPECLRPLPGFGFSIELRDFDGEPAGFAYIDGINFVLDYVLTNATGGITYAAGYPLDLNDLPGTAAPL